MCLIGSILISMIEQAHGANPTSDIDIGASQTQLLSEVVGIFCVIIFVSLMLLIAIF